MASAPQPVPKPAATVLGHENQAEFNSLLESLIEEFGAQSQHERFLVEQMAQANWRIARIDRIENATLDQIAKAGDPQLHPDARIAAHLLSSGAAVLNALQRSRTADQNSYAKCCKLLCDSVASRIARRTATNLDKSIARIVYAPLPGQPAMPRGPVSQSTSLRL